MTKPLVDLSVRHVVIHGHRRAYVDAGPRSGAPVLLLLHGIGDDHRTWDLSIADLAADFRVIAPDFLGHGQSAKPRADYTVAGFANGMRDLLSYLRVEHVTVVGHSLGGGVAMQFAYQYPERVDRVILVASGGLGASLSPLLRVLSLPGGRPLLALGESLPARVLLNGLAPILKRLPGRPFVDIEQGLQVSAHLRQGDARRAFLHVLRGAVDFRGQVITMVDRLYLADTLPVMVLWGDRDSIIPVGHARRAAALMPSIDVQVLPGGGHFPHRDAPVWFTDRVRELMATTAPARHDQQHWRQVLRHAAEADAARTAQA
jgi:pimeloyl-ACP methyl ester carboxylesterase